MFDIEYKGGNTVIIATKGSRLVTDPNLSVVGLKELNLKDAVVAATESRLLGDAADARLVIDGPGEYEVADFSITGIPATRHIDTEADEKIATIYRVDVGDVRLVIFGNIAHKLSEDQLEAIGVVDVVIIPVGGGGYTLDAVNAAHIIRQVDPKLVIPVHYADADIKYEVPQDELSLFVKELGAPVETMPKYKLKSAAALPVSLTISEITHS